MQQRLFPEVVSDTVIRGLICLPDFLDKQTESKLIDIIDAQPWLNDLKRRVQHYGYRYDYKARNITPESKLAQIPGWLSSYCRKLYENGAFPKIPDQVIINEYLPGQGIAPHIDCIPCFGKTIASLSLSTSCVMDFTHSKSGEKISIILEPRSLLILSDDARYLWRHSIASRKTDKYNGTLIERGTRISLTFREVLVA